MVNLEKLQKKFNNTESPRREPIPLTEEQLKEIPEAVKRFRESFDVDANNLVSDDRALYFINSGICKNNPISMKRFSHIMKEE